jgi:hypothetical protein
VKNLRAAIWIVLVLLSLLAGAAKFLQMEQEASLFASAGLAPYWLIPLGALQVAGAALALFKQTRRFSPALVGVGFLISAMVIFMTGQAVFGFASLIPVALSALIAYPSNRAS